MWDKTMCIVLIPASTCALHMATISIGELTNILKLNSTEDITIVKQTDTALWLRCSGPGVKRHIMSWETRSTAEKEFAIRVKEDLWRHERVQKAKMWPVMQALFVAGLRPTWSRASVTWRTSEGRFFIHPGDLPWSLSASEIVNYAKSGCTTLPLSQTPPQPRTSAQHVHSSCQTDVIAESNDTPLKHLVTALKQDLALAKQRIAAQAIQCCFWRQKYKALEAMVGPHHKPTNPHLPLEHVFKQSLSAHFMLMLVSRPNHLRTMLHLLSKPLPCRKQYSNKHNKCNKYKHTSTL